MNGECEQWAERLFEPEEALSELEKSGLAAHLARCEDCAIEREIFLDSWSTLDDFEEEVLEPCSLLRAKVWQKIREEQCLPKPLLPSFRDESGHWRRPVLKIAAAAAAILLGFGLGRSIRSESNEIAAEPGAGVVAAKPDGMPLDPALIQLASQEGFSLDLLPESTQFSPIDPEMMSALASSRESRRRLERERGMVVPVEYISRSLPPQKQNPR